MGCDRERGPLRQWQEPNRSHPDRALPRVDRRASDWRLETEGALENICHLTDMDMAGIVDACEEERGTNPTFNDMGADGLKDGDEVRTQRTDRLNLDPDGAEGTHYDTSPVKRATDGDGASHAFDEAPLDPNND